MKRMLSIVRRAQAESLMGPYSRPSAAELLAPYDGLGDTSIPYAIGDPAALREIKSALIALGARAADSLRSSDPAVETRWQEIRLDEEVPSWDAATADEFAIAVGRYRGWGWQVPGPYASLSPGGPQPTASGLELLAGAVNELLGGTPRMVRYEQWREGAFAPPSRVSGPDPNAPILPMNFFGPDHLFAPIGTDADIAEQIAAADRMMTEGWQSALDAGDEAARAQAAATVMLGRSLRSAWIDEAIRRADVREGTTEVTRMDTVACERLGGQWNPDQSLCEQPEAAAAGTGPVGPWPILVVGGLLLGAALLPRTSARASGLTGKLAR